MLPSPTGKWILFGRGGDGPGLWIVRPDGSGKRKLFRGVDCPGPPFYAPVASYGWTFGGRGVYAGKSDRRHPLVRMLSGGYRTLPVVFDGEPYAMSLDGRRVAWAAGNYSKTIRTARADGDERRDLALFQSARFLDVDVDALEWSPGARRLAIEPHGRQYPARRRR